MSSSDRRAVLALLAALPMAACGFTPAYGPGGPAQGLIGQVRVDDPGDKNAFDLVERLEERLGRTQQPTLRLSYRISTREQGQAIAPDNSITRYQVFGTAAFTLRDAATGTVLTEGEVEGFTAYSAVGTRVESDASAADAKVRLMRILADRIVTRLIATSALWTAR
jgi:LPS-assembly lipoprotein